MSHCGAINCSNSKLKAPDLTFHCFPWDPVRSKRWVQLTRRADLEQKSPAYLYENVRLCSKHFEPSQYLPGSKRLKKNAVPTQFDIPNPPKPVSSQRRPLVKKETNEDRAARPKKAGRTHVGSRHQDATAEQRQQRLAAKRERMAVLRRQETPQQRQRRLTESRERHAVLRQQRLTKFGSTAPVGKARRNTDRQDGSVSVCDVRDCWQQVPSRLLIRFPPLSRVHERAAWWIALHGRLNFALTEESAPTAAICERHFSTHAQQLPDRALPAPLGLRQQVPPGLLRRLSPAPPPRRPTPPRRPAPPPPPPPVRTSARLSTKRSAARARAEAAKRTEATASKQNVLNRFKPIAPALTVTSAPDVASTAHAVLSAASAGSATQIAGSSGGAIRLQLPPALATAGSIRLVPAGSSAAPAQSYQLMQAAAGSSHASPRYTLAKGTPSELLLLPQKQPGVAQVVDTLVVSSNCGGGRAMAPTPMQMRTRCVSQAPIRSQKFLVRVLAPPRAVQRQLPPNAKLPTVLGALNSVVPTLRPQVPKSTCASNSPAPAQPEASDVHRRDGSEVMERVLGLDSYLTPNEEVGEASDEADCGSNFVFVSEKRVQDRLTCKYEASRAYDGVLNEDTIARRADDIHRVPADSRPSEQLESALSSSVVSLVKCEVPIKEEDGILGINGNMKETHGADEASIADPLQDLDNEDSVETMMVYAVHKGYAAENYPETSEKSCSTLTGNVETVLKHEVDRNEKMDVLDVSNIKKEMDEFDEESMPGPSEGSDDKNSLLVEGMLVDAIQRRHANGNHPETSEALEPTSNGILQNMVCEDVQEDNDMSGLVGIKKESDGVG